MVYDTSGVYTDPDVQIDLNQFYLLSAKLGLKERERYRCTLAGLKFRFWTGPLKDISVLLTFVRLIFKIPVAKAGKMSLNALCQTGHHYA